MADDLQPIAPGFPEELDPAKSYRVQLSKGVPFAGMTLNPADVHTMSGAALEGLLAGEHKDSIYGASESQNT